MSDSSGDSLRGGSDRTVPRWAAAVPLAVVVAIGLLAAFGGAASDPGANGSDDGVTVTTACENETNVLEFDNPTDEPVETTVYWESDVTSLSIQSDGTVSPQIQTESTHVNGEERTTHTLTTTVPADENVTLVGLHDGEYDLSATADGEDVDLNETVVDLDCGAVDDDGLELYLTSEEIDLEDET